MPAQPSGPQRHTFQRRSTRPTNSFHREMCKFNFRRPTAGNATGPALRVSELLRRRMDVRLLLRFFHTCVADPLDAAYRVMRSTGVSGHPAQHVDSSLLAALLADFSPTEIVQQHKRPSQLTQIQQMLAQFQSGHCTPHPRPCIDRRRAAQAGDFCIPLVVSVPFSVPPGKTEQVAISRRIPTRLWFIW